MKRLSSHNAPMLRLMPYSLLHVHRCNSSTPSHHAAPCSTIMAHDHVTLRGIQSSSYSAWMPMHLAWMQPRSSGLVTPQHHHEGGIGDLVMTCTTGIMALPRCMAHGGWGMAEGVHCTCVSGTVSYLQRHMSGTPSGNARTHRTHANGSHTIKPPLLVESRAHNMT